MTDAVERAKQVAELVLLPDAATVDRADRVPAAHLAALDAAGLTGLAATEPSLATRVDVAMELASGCLATALVWLQHQGALAAVAESPLASRWIPRLASGDVRAGLSITALRPPEPLTATREAGGWRVVGRVPWVTGWGGVDVLRVAALDGSGRIVQLLVDASDAIGAEPIPLIAANASRTVELRFEGLPVPADRLLGTASPKAWAEADSAGLAGNGALALGVAARAVVLAGSAALADEVVAARAALLAAGVDDLPAVRAGCSALALRAATAHAVTAGARSAVVGSDAERLSREAVLTAVFGSRPAIRAALLDTLGG